MMNQWRILLLIVLSLGMTSSAFAIVGGVATTDLLPNYLTETDRTQIQSHTVVVLNSQNPSNHSRCTGTLIAKNVVLTAAHCIPDSIEALYVVTSIYEFAVMQQKKITRVIVHEDYKSFDIPKLNQPNSDLALVQFEGELPPEYKPTNIITNFTPQMDRFWLYVAGYGISRDNESDSGELRFSRVTIQNALLNANQSFMMGDQSTSEGICKGDSGGPAYLKIQNRFYVIGVVSAIVGGCFGKSYFNQTVFYQDWIQKNLKKIVSN